MTTATIESIVAEHARLGALIASLQASAPTLLTIKEAQIELRAGERYAGLMLDANGQPSHHLVLLPGDAEDVSWEDAKKWATEAGGELPSRREQALLYANLKDQFDASEWYWSAEAHESDSSYAWDQDFSNGFQSCGHQSYEGRARAVRRFTA